jgi:ABC-type transport system involved in cytochrome c biogenesis permease subunit
VLALLLFFAVVRPAIERGGVGELVAIAALFIAILLGERWLRSR